MNRQARLCAYLAATALLLAPATSQARTLHVRDEGTLRFVRSSGEHITDEGRAHGTIPAWVRVHFTYNGEPTVTASFTIWEHGFMLTGHASGHLHNPTSLHPSFRGNMTITSGSGRYRHAHGSGELFGVFDHRSYALTVQAISTLHY